MPCDELLMRKSIKTMGVSGVSLFGLAFSFTLSPLLLSFLLSFHMPSEWAVKIHYSLHCVDSTAFGTAWIPFLLLNQCFFKSMVHLVFTEDLDQCKGRTVLSS